jgi:hypothetical protein
MAQVTSILTCLPERGHEAVTDASRELEAAGSAGYRAADCTFTVQWSAIGRFCFRFPWRRVCFLWILMCIAIAKPSHASRNIVEVRNPYCERPVENPSMKLAEDLRIRGGTEEEFFFSRIADIAVDGTGRVYVVENSQNKVLVFDRGGAFIDNFGRQGEGPGDFTLPMAIAFDGEGLTYVADQYRISVFDSARTFVRSFDYGIAGGIVNGMVLDGQRCVFISCFEVFGQQIIHKYSNDGKSLVSFCDSYAIDTQEDVRIEQTYAGGSIDIDDGGAIWFSQRNPYEIRKFSGAGELLMVVYRENGFMHPPVVVRHGDAWEFRTLTASWGFGILSDGTIINSVSIARDSRKNYPWPSFVDVFAKSGDLLGSIGLDPVAIFCCADRSDRLYFVRYGSEDQEVMRCRLVR